MGLFVIASCSSSTNTKTSDSTTTKKECVDSCKKDTCVVTKKQKDTTKK